MKFSSIAPWSNQDGRLTLQARQWVDQQSADATDFIRPEDYEGDDGTTIAAALTAGAEAGTPVRLDGSYEISAPISIALGTEKLTVTGGGLITVTGDIGTAIEIAAELNDPVTISAIASSSHTFPGGSSGTTASKITAAGHGCSIGDWVKVVAEDQLPGSTSSGRRVGEFAYAADVSGNDIYVMPLYETYSTGKRLARVNTAAGLVWDGPTFAATPNELWTVVFLGVRGIYLPFIRGGHSFGYSIGLELQSTIMADVDWTIRDSLNLVNSEGIAGYGVQAGSSLMSRVNVRGTDGRHFYTDVTYTAADGSPEWKYGRTVQSHVTGFGVASSAAAFDTHTESRDVVFDGVQTQGTLRGESASASAIQLRSLRGIAKNWQAVGDTHGLQFTGAVADGCTDCRGENGFYRGTGDAVRLDGSDATIVRPVVSGGYYESSNAEVMRLENCTGALIENVYLKPTGNGAGDCGILCRDGTQATIRNLVVDLSGFTGSNFRPINIDTSADVDLYIDGITVLNGNIQAFVSCGSGGTGTGSVITRNLRGPLPTVSGNAQLINTGSMTTAFVQDNWNVLGSWTYSSNVTHVDFTGILSDEIAIVMRGVTLGASETRDIQLSADGGSTWSTSYYAIDAAGVESNVTSIPLHATASGSARSSVAVLRGLRGTTKTVSALGLAYVPNQASPTSAIRILSSGGSNLTAGTIQILGRV